MDNHTFRVNSEIRATGVTTYGMKKFAIKHLPDIIHPDEHVGGVVYGRYKKNGEPAFGAGVLVATDKRILFLDHKPGFMETDEITYDVVAGIKTTTAIFSSVLLQTRVGDFNIGFANPTCVKNFVKFVEYQGIERNKRNN